MTVEAMRAAVIAIRSGNFDDLNDLDVVWRGQASRAAGPVAASRPAASSIPWVASNVGDPVVLVMAGHAGAGASTVALAVAEGLAEARRVQLVDYAEPVQSGLVAAPAIEMGTDGAWRRGRRNRLDVVRLTRHPADGVLPPPPETDDAEPLRVVDAGWSLTRTLLDPPGSVVGGAMVVVVTRVTVPSVRQTEQLLAAVGVEAAVAAVGPARWPRLVEVSCGPRLRELRSRGQVVPVPIDRQLQIAGLTGDRLPKPVAAAGRSLAALVAPAGETP
ncbi:hypothetical protein GCM10023162_01910 [Klenkia terrae]